MEDIVQNRYKVTYYVEYENVPKEVLTKKKIDKNRLLHLTYIPLDEEIFEPKAQGFGNYNGIAYARHLAIERVKNFERLQRGEQIKDDSVHQGILVNDFYKAEFKIVGIVKQWKVPLEHVFAVIRFQDANDIHYGHGDQIYGKIKTDALQVYELVREFEKVSKLTTYVLKGHFINSERMLILKEAIEFLLNKNDAYRFIFYRVELTIKSGEGTKQILKDFRSQDSIKNREQALLFLTTFYQGFFFEQGTVKEPQNNIDYREGCSIQRKLFAIPCPFWKRKTEISELISAYKPILFENDFDDEWDVKEKLEEERRMFEKYWIDIRQTETKVYEAEKGVLKTVYDDNNIDRLVYFADEYASHNILKGSRVLLNGKFI